MTNSDTADTHTILVVDDDDAIRTLLAETLQDEGFRVVEAKTGAEVLPTVQRESPDVVLLDLRMPDQSGMLVMESVHAKAPDIPVVIMTAHDSSSAAIQATSRGAYDYVIKPFNLDEISHTVRRAVEHRVLTRRVREIEQPATTEVHDRFVGRTPAMQDIFKTIGRVAPSDSTVMIYGESGTGKEVAANAIHYNSPRRAGPFIKVSCASFVETLLESELFGHEKGAFTHAVTQRKGRFELANKGTIFLDEIGEMSMNTQKKLLRVLQEREFERVGSSVTLKTDVRVLTATNRDLLKDVTAGRFREDLYFRLNVIAMTMPPLRDRREDIPLLVEHFLDVHRFGPNHAKARISSEAMEMMMGYTWPGNVRDLENTVERAVVLSRGDVITPQHLSFVPATGAASIDVAQRVATGVSLEAMLAEVERTAIEESLRHSGGSRGKAAQRLGMDLRGFNRKLHDYDLSADDAETDTDTDQGG